MARVIRACDIAKARKDLEVGALEKRVSRLEKELEALKKAFVRDSTKAVVPAFEVPYDKTG